MSLRTIAEMVGIAVASVLLWISMHKPAAPVNQQHEAKKAPEISNVPTETIKPAKLVVYAKPAKQKLDLPPTVQDDKDKYVLSASKVNSDLHPQTLTTIYDANTGKTDTLVRRDPYPWLAAEHTGEVWVGYGVKNGGVKVGMLSVTEELLQIRALHFGLSGSVATDGSLFAGIGAGYRW